MIKIENVTKIYKASNKITCKALDDVSFTLPDKGMVFIIGKSGSGKSTLLNLIGGLDDVTSGKIIADSNEITSLKHKELTKYRSSYVGFVFQDYHVIENLTVRENVALSLEIANDKNIEKIDEVLEQVELSEYQNRRPKELSGGQKQRIAVARAVVKDSKVLLCDEPTGNLDKKTTQQVMHILKSISQEKLVVVVSHNMVDAESYADRIIELADGKLVRDRKRTVNYNNDFRIEDGKIYLPHYRDLEAHEVDAINDAIESNSDIKFVQVNNRFLETKEVEENSREVKLEAASISRKTANKLYKIFFSKKLSMALSIFLAALLLVCFAIFQSFLSFDANKELSKSLTNHNIYTVPLLKGSNTDNDIVTIGKIKALNSDDIPSFKDAGYKGNIYVKYNSTLPIAVTSSSIDGEGAINLTSNLKSFYVRETFGVIQCDSEFLTSLYGIEDESGNKKLNILAKSTDPKEYGIMIPDYVADSIIKLNVTEGLTYQDVLGEFRRNKNPNAEIYGYINAIFDTDYEEKYKELIDEFEYGLENPDKAASIYDKVKDTELFSDFMIDAMTYLCYGYTTNDNYQESLKTMEYRNWHRINSIELTNRENKEVYNSSTQITLYDNKKLADNELILCYTTYKALFDEVLLDYNEFEPFTTTLTIYDGKEANGKILYQKEFKITKIVSSTINYINVEANMDLRDYDIIEYGLLLENHEMIDKMTEVATDRSFAIYVSDTTKLTTVNKLLNTFGDFFLMIEIIFLVITIIYLVNIGLSSIRKNKYEIGVLKAIGVNNFDIMKLFIRQSLILVVFIGIVSNIGIYIGTHIANKILIEAFEKILAVSISEIRLISYIPSVVIQDLFNIAIISIASFIIPQILLFKIKPIEIIKAKE